MCNTTQIGVREVRWQSGDEDPERGGLLSGLKVAEIRAW
jgi:hypothetical protein